MENYPNSQNSPPVDGELIYNEEKGYQDMEKLFKERD